MQTAYTELSTMFESQVKDGAQKLQELKQSQEKNRMERKIS